MSLFSLKFARPLWRALFVLSFAVVFALVLYGPFAARHDALSGETPLQIGTGLFKIGKPLVISTAPVIRVDSGAVNFETGKSARKSNFISGILPEGWAQFFLKERLEAAALVNGHITLDLRTPDGGGDSAVAGDAVNRQLQQSYLSSVALSDCAVKILRDGAAPLMLHVRAGRFDIDLADGDLSGGGVVTVDGRLTNFTLASEYEGAGDSGVPQFSLQVRLDNDHFNGRFDGMFSNGGGVRLSGDTQVEFKDEAALGLLFDLPVQKDIAGEGRRAGQKGEAKGTVTPGAYFASAAGRLEWGGNQGTLADGKFQFGDSPATGTLTLKLNGDVRDISGTLAFARLDLSKLVENEGEEPVVEVAGSEPGAAESETAGKAAPLPLRDAKLRRMLQTLSPLIRDFNADLRISADEIIAGPLLFRETGFSLFQKKGEVIIDLAETMIFQGTASGHVKIDTNFPKPRWHINMGLKDAEMGEVAALVNRPQGLAGRGKLKVHLTSFGDKANEIYQNMYGALLFSMPDGGTIGLNLDNLLTAQENRSGTELSDLTAGSSDFTNLQGTGHFAHGAVVTDHFSLKTKSNQFTGRGRLNLFDRLVDWHVASWPLQVAEKTDDGSLVKETGVASSKAEAPLLLVCSEISGSWDAPKFRKYTAMHLALLRRGCPAPFQPPPMKSDNRKIAPVGNAG